MQFFLHTFPFRFFILKISTLICAIIWDFSVLWLIIFYNWCLNWYSLNETHFPVSSLFFLIGIRASYYLELWVNSSWACPSFFNVTCIFKSNVHIHNFRSINTTSRHHISMLTFRGLLVTIVPKSSNIRIFLISKCFISRSLHILETTRRFLGPREV